MKIILEFFFDFQKKYSRRLCKLTNIKSGLMSLNLFLTAPVLLVQMLCHNEKDKLSILHVTHVKKGAQWLSGRVFDSRPRGRGFEPHRRHCVVSLSKNINPSLVLVHPGRLAPL